MRRQVRSINIIFWAVTSSPVLCLAPFCQLYPESCSRKLLSSLIVVIVSNTVRVSKCKRWLRTEITLNNPPFLSSLNYKLNMYKISWKKVGVRKGHNPQKSGEDTQGRFGVVPIVALLVASCGFLMEQSFGWDHKNCHAPNNYGKRCPSPNIALYFVALHR